MKILAMTIHDRTPEVIDAVFTGLSLPGNRVDSVAVCYDRAKPESISCVRAWCERLNIELREAILSDGFAGPRCPSKAWNAALDLVTEDHAFCISSDMVLGPHSIGMAYHMSEIMPECIIVGRAEHCGQNYVYRTAASVIQHRTMTSSVLPHPLGFDWLLPMDSVRSIGGYDESYMHGLCYEDDDFVIRMWEAGAEWLFCDDIMGFHLEHGRDHLDDEDGRVTLNRNLFVDKYGDEGLLKQRSFPHHAECFDVGMCAITREQRPNLPTQCFNHQHRYRVCKCFGQS